MPITRLAVLPDKRRILLGIDKANVFEAGQVYELSSMLDEIIFRKVGRYALPPTGHPSEVSENNAIIYSGLHLLTDDELKLYAAQQHNKRNNT